MAARAGIRFAFISGQEEIEKANQERSLHDSFFKSVHDDRQEVRFKEYRS